MLPLAIDKFDLFILKQLFPNFKLSMEQIMKGFEKNLLKELEALSRYDLRKYFSLEKTAPITDDHILSCATAILFDFEYEELFYEIDTRLNEKLGKLQVEEDDLYKLTKYGLELYNRIGLSSKDRIKDKIIDIKEITDLSTLKVKTIIATEHETKKKLILTLTQHNFKQAKFNYWEITKKPIYIRGIENEVGIFKTVFYFQFSPPPILPKRIFIVLSFISRNNVLGDYLLKSEQEGEIYKIKSSMFEPFIPLDPANWNYNEGLYQSIRGGIKIELEKPVLGTGIILGFDSCRVIVEGDEYLNQTLVNLLDMKLHTKDKDSFTVPIPGNRTLILLWSDLEYQLDMERKDFLKKKNSLKRKGDEAMLVLIEGNIKRKEILAEDNRLKTLLYLDEPEITGENF